MHQGQNLNGQYRDIKAMYHSVPNARPEPVIMVNKSNVKVVFKYVNNDNYARAPIFVNQPLIALTAPPIRTVPLLPPQVLLTQNRNFAINTSQSIATQLITSPSIPVQQIRAIN